MAAPQPVISVSVRHQFDQEVAFLHRLVRTKSANPFLPEASRPDVPIEAEAAAVIHEELHQLGWLATSYGSHPSAPMCSVGSTQRCQREKP